ncbi:MAG: NgoFVII family restriction endonuclease [Eubacterium sp.]|nr:NgoFVII family restriction endonuclease [Eubacterium sp.]MCC8160949.1 NgoFVII family restriction endonuclease [Oscillospiraceae bacterium]
MPQQYSDKTAKVLLFEPIALGTDRLCIISRRATPSMASWLLKSYESQKISNVEVELVIESAMNYGIDLEAHESFKELCDIGKFSCSYLHKGPASTTNFYIWFRKDEPVKMFSCNCDFTQSSLLREQSSTPTECNLNNAYRIYTDTIDRSIFCTHGEVEDYIVIQPSASFLHAAATVNPQNTVCLPLLTRNGDPGNGSCLNWGHRDKRNKNEAYIRIPREIAKSGFFPSNDQHFLAVTDDHRSLLLRVEQQGNKALTTPASNAQLGEYFRNRLGLSNGANITREDLMAYGRTDVTFYKIDDEQYYMDFSQPSETR